MTLDEEVATAVAAAAAGSSKPCAATFLGMRGVTGALTGKDVDEHGMRRVVPAYAMPEDAVRALAAATRYGEWRARDKGERVPRPGSTGRAAERLVEQVLADARRPAGPWSPRRWSELLSAYGITVWPTRAGVHAPTRPSRRPPRWATPSS